MRGESCLSCVAAMFQSHAGLWRNVSPEQVARSGVPELGVRVRHQACLKRSEKCLFPDCDTGCAAFAMKALPNLTALLLAAGLNTTMALPTLAAGTQWADQPVLPDPSLANGGVFRPSVATAGTAAVSAEADGPLLDCSRRNPCAMPTPARDHVAVIAGGAATTAYHRAAASPSVAMPKSIRATPSELSGKPAS